MNLNPLLPYYQPSFWGIYQYSKKCGLGKVDVGKINGRRLSIYTQDNYDGSIQKVYYLVDSFGKWIKSKIKIIK